MHSFLRMITVVKILHQMPIWVVAPLLNASLSSNVTFSVSSTLVTLYNIYYPFSHLSYIPYLLFLTEFSSLEFITNTMYISVMYSVHCLSPSLIKWEHMGWYIFTFILFIRVSLWSRTVPGIYWLDKYTGVTECNAMHIKWLWS